MEHGVIPTAVRVNNTDPAVKSAELGIYTGLITCVLEKEPVPVEVQVRLAA